MNLNFFYKYSKEHSVDERLCSYLISYYLKIDKKIKLKHYLKFFYAINKIKNNYPIQYIVKNVNFYGYDFKVNKNVLIPRFETELLVEKLLIELNNKYKNKKIKVLDLATGSGCIGITLKKERSNIDLTISDICKKALRVAKFNSKDIDLKIIKGDLLKPFIFKKQKFDVIVSNPPYIDFSEKVDKSIEKEPKKAIYAKNNGLYYYEEIFQNLIKVLKKDYLICLEIGESQKKEIINLKNKYLKNSKIRIIKDYNNKDRIVLIKN